MMTAKVLIDSNMIWSYECSATQQVAFLAEYRVGKAIAQDNGQGGISDQRTRFVVRSPEGGNNNLGILVGREFPNGLEGTDIKKFVELVDSNVKARNVVALDVKSFMPRMIHSTATPIVQLTPQQTETCQALIIITPKEPNFVIVLPVQFFRRREKVCHEADTDFYFSGLRVSWTLHPLPAFPPELTLFVLPFSDMEQAVADMRDYSTGSASEW